MKTYNELVRDRIPELIEQGGGEARVRTLSDAEYAAELNHKLIEETAEYLESEELDELADVLEVVQALAEYKGMTFEDLLRMKAENRALYGAFERRLFLEAASGRTGPVKN